MTQPTLDIQFERPSLESIVEKLDASRVRVARLEEEVKIAKDNLKLARSEMDSMIRRVCEMAEPEIPF